MKIDYTPTILRNGKNYFILNWEIEQLDWWYCFSAKLDDLEENIVMDLPFLKGLWSVYYADGVC